MLILLTFLLPTIAAIVVYNLFRQDLAHAKSEYKLKRGALENLVERHRNAIYLHLFIFVATASISWMLFGIDALMMIILWSLVYMGHVNAFIRFAKSLIAALDSEIDTSRLQDNDDSKLSAAEDIEQSVSSASKR